MKKLVLLLSVILFTACSTSDEPCECEKEVWRNETTVVFLSNGLPVTSGERVTVSREIVPCQEEQEQVRINHAEYFTIRCN
jgi:hypothetical protein